MVLPGRTKFTRLIILGVTPPDVYTLSAAVGIPDEPGTGLAIHRPLPDDRGTLPREVFHEIRFFHQVKDTRLGDPWPVRYRQGLRVNEGTRIISTPATRFNGLFRSRLGRGGGNTNGGDVWASVRTG